MNGKRILGAAVCGLAVLLAGCQANPEQSVVVHKNMEDLISQAQTEGAGTVDAQALQKEVGAGERYQTRIENESLHVTVAVDAAVEVPEAQTLNVYRVRQKKWDPAFVEKVRRALLGDQPLYDAAALSVETKSVLEARIAQGREAYQKFEADLRSQTEDDGTPFFTEEEIQTDLEQAQWEYIDRWQEAYETAPETVDLQEYAIDGQLHAVSDLYAGSPERYDYYHQLIPEGDVLYAVTDGSGGPLAEFKAVNSDRYSNWMVYSARWDRMPALHNGVLGPKSSLDPEQIATGQPQNPDLPENFLSDISYGWNETTRFVPLAGDETTLSQEEAIEQAQAFLEQVGLEDFAFGEGGLYNEYADADDYDPQTNTVTYRHYYILHFFRSVDGALLTQSSGSKYSEEHEIKQIWPGETVEFKINDRGIVGFAYDSPVEITETVVAGAAMKPFAQIRDTFESMVCMVNAEEEEQNVLSVDRVRLSYSRISEQNAFDTGLIVPVWSFEGKKESSVENVAVRTQVGTLLAINAIDGSVIDSALGY